MFGRKLYSILLLAILAGCAEPKYIKGSDSGNEGTSAQESKAECQATFSNSQLCLAWHWEKKPTSTEMGSLVFKTYRLNSLDQTPIEVDLTTTPQVVLWMPSMGHGSTPTQTARVDEGTYRASNVFFIMPGDWEIRFQVKNGTEVIDETHINLVF
jgi:YtkA-like